MIDTNGREEIKAKIAGHQQEIQRHNEEIALLKSQLLSINCVGDLMKHLEKCDPQEPISFRLETKNGTRLSIKYGGMSSTAGGRAIVMWFDEE